MAKTGYKLRNVNCLKIGRKANRLFITGGDDHNVNLWMIGKATSVMSLRGHTSAVESVTFDSAEVLVLSGASSGVIKLWDLQEAKMLRTLPGHRSNCTAVEFHPFGEFFASGSSDTSLNIWDIRKKGCIQAYKGHSQGISTIKFSPDGRWVVSGGFDNVVKVWDLTGGKLLHDFKFHEGHISSLDFHPLEFLLATGSADRTVKFWDLETFELIGSSRHEVSGVRSLTFHPDGRTLFAGLEDSLKVYSWEPVICHDAVDMGWTTLGDLCIHDEKLLGCSFYSNSVGVWVSDISLIKPYGDGLENENKESTEQKLSVQGRQMEKIENGVHNESKEIKNIYIDSSKGNPDNLLRPWSYNSPKMDRLEESKEMLNLSSETGVRAKSNEQTLRKSFIVSNVVPLDILNDIDSREFVDTISNSVSATDPNFEMKLGSHNEARDSLDNKHPIRSVTEKFEKTLTPDRFSEQEKLAVVQGRTRSLVERFERKDIIPTKEDQDNATPTTTFENSENFLKEDQTNASPTTTTSTSEKGEIIPFSKDKNNMSTVLRTTSETDKHTNFMKAEFGRDSNSANDGEIIEDLLQTHDVTLSNLRSRLTKLQVVRQFWERNDTKGAINALEKFPDQSVQADVISVLVEKMEILTLDLFSCLLPVLTGLLDSKIERHVIHIADLIVRSGVVPNDGGLWRKMTRDDLVNISGVCVWMQILNGHVKVSLDMVLKLVVVFGPTIRSTISAPPSVKVDQHAEQRRECSNHCFMQLQKIRIILPILARRGGVLAKCAQELDLVLRQP